MVCLVNDDHFESLPCALLNLLSLGHLLQQVLDDDSVVVANIGRRNFQMVYGSDCVEFKLAIRGSLEDA